MPLARRRSLPGPDVARSGLDISVALCKTQPAPQLAPACPALQMSPRGEGRPSHDRWAGCTTARGSRLPHLQPLGSTAAPRPPKGPSRLLASAQKRSVSEACRKPPPGPRLQEGRGVGAVAERSASFDAPHKPLSVPQGTHWWAYKQGDKRCLQRLKAAHPLSWLSRGACQRSSPVGRPFQGAGRRAQGSFSPAPAFPPSQVLPEGTHPLGPY